MDLSAYIEENHKTRIFKSELPDLAKSEPCLLGVDEAGRGPVLGPMVYGICYCPIKEKERLIEMKFADSKTLSGTEREDLFHALHKTNDVIGWMLQVISPNVISNSMLSRCKYNLNALSHDAAIELIQTAVDDGVNVKEVYVDTVGDPDKYQKKLQDKFPDITVTVSKKADSLFPIVSAASIVAKVARDEALKDWKFREDVETDCWGSGYPNDPETKNFLQKSCDRIFGFPQMVRFSWSTAEKIIEDKCVPVDWEDVEDDVANTPSVLSYFARQVPDQQKKQKIHRFFNDCNLKRVVNIE